jgi:stage V sporulation protein G
MKITEIKVYPVNEDKLKAYVTVTFENCFVVRDLKVIQGNNRLFVAMPSRRMKDGSYRDIVHPSNAEMRETLEKAIFDKYNETLKSPEATKKDYDTDHTGS